MNSKKVFLTIGIVIIIVVVAIFGVKMCINNMDKAGDDIATDIKEKVEELSQEEILSNKVDEEIKTMTLREKIGQMLVITFSGAEYTEKLDLLLKDVKPCGVILFQDNISDYDTTVQNINLIKSTSLIPMLVAIDQEGGRVQKIKNVEGVNVTEIPDMLTLGKTEDIDVAYKVGKVIGEEIAAFGVNTDFAPVVDVFSNPNNTVIGNRAFGTNAKMVTDMALPLAKGLKSAGVIPTFKHFPGHGDTDADSHVELPVVTKTKEELYENELKPFKAAIDDGAEMIMVAHIALPNVTGSYIPASLSKDMINGILRKEMGFKGVVISDAVNMKGLSNNYTVEQICEYSILAGTDIILMPVNPVETVDIIESLVKKGTITEDRIDESVKRILIMKHNNNLYEEKTLNKEKIGTQNNIDIINKIK